MPFTVTQPKLYYEDRGSGEPLLAITGFAVASSVLDPVADLYATRLRCITYDHPGTGRSSKRSFPCTTAHLAASAIRVLDELGIESAHVAGFSLGGAIAQELALRFPHRVRGLILISTSTAGPLSTPPNVGQLVSVAPRIVGGSLLRRRLWLEPAIFSPEFLQRDPDRARALLRPFFSNPAAPWGILGQFLAAGLHDRALDLHRIRAPTLVLHGDRDVLVPVSNARLLVDGIADAELHLIEGAGHGVSMEHLEATFDVMCDWLDRRQPTAPARPGGIAGRTERLSRALSIQLGALRLGRSSAVLASRFIGRQVATHRRSGSPRR